MATIFAKGHLNATFRVKLKDIMRGADIDVSLINDQFIVFYKPDGTNFQKQATLDADLTNPSQVIPIVNIVGDGIEDKITVTIANTNVLKDGELMTISGTVNFNITNKPITIVDGTKFTYLLGTVGNVAAESVGDVTTQGEKLVTYQNTTPEVSILDNIGKWEFAGKVTLTNNDEFPTSDRAIFWVT